MSVYQDHPAGSPERRYLEARDKIAVALCRYIRHVTGVSAGIGYRRAYDVIDWMDATLPTRADRLEQAPQGRGGGEGGL